MNVRKHSLLVLLLCLLTACSGLKNYDGPDAFRVVSNPPLRLPPDYSLRPPLKKSAAGQLKQGAGWKPSGPADPKKAAEVTLVNGDVLPGPAESAFLQRAGTDQANPDIRTILAEDERRAMEAEENKGIVHSLLGLEPDADEEEGEAAIDVEEEAEREAVREEALMDRIMRTLFGDSDMPVDVKKDATELEATEPAAGMADEDETSAAGSEENSLQKFWDGLFE